MAFYDDNHSPFRFSEDFPPEFTIDGGTSQGDGLVEADYGSESEESRRYPLEGPMDNNAMPYPHDLFSYTDGQQRLQQGLVNQTQLRGNSTVDWPEMDVQPMHIEQLSSSSFDAQVESTAYPTSYQYNQQGLAFDPMWTNTNPYPPEEMSSSSVNHPPVPQTDYGEAFNIGMDSTSDVREGLNTSLDVSDLLIDYGFTSAVETTDSSGQQPFQTEYQRMEACSNDPIALGLQDHEYRISPYESTLPAQTDGPWSAVHMRQDSQRMALESQVNQLMHRTSVSSTSQSSNAAGTVSSLWLTDTSISNTNIDGVNSGWGDASAATIVPNGLNQWQAATNNDGCQPAAVNSGRAEDCIPSFVLRESTPGPIDSLLFETQRVQNENLQPIPPSPNPSSVPSSPPNYVPDTLRCELCNRDYTGQWRKSNFARHNRDKHRDDEVQTWPCADNHCNRVFKRKDARLKHYRKWHPRLAAGPPVLRKNNNRPRQAAQGPHGNLGAAFDMDQTLREVGTQH